VSWNLAEFCGCTAQEIQHALATLRTPSADPKRGTLNVSPAARARVEELKLPGEAIWQTVNRILDIE
jgi:hypothetical protein